jgi:plastocyanin
MAKAAEATREDRLGGAGKAFARMQAWWKEMILAMRLLMVAAHTPSSGGLFMRARLLLPLAAVALAAACGGDSGTNVPPPVATEVFTVTNSGFSPETLNVVSNTRVIWRVTEGTHVISFTGQVPAGGNPNSRTLTAVDSVSTIFLQTGTYTFRDSLNATHTGVVIVHS